MSRVSVDDIKANLDLEQWAERESLAYKMGRGRSGMQLQLKDCPLCNGSKWRVYLNADTGLGNCFQCGEHFNKLTFIQATLGLDKDDWRSVFVHCEEVLRDQGFRARRRIEIAVETPEAKLPRSLPLPRPDGTTLDYLVKRDISPELTRTFHLRYSVGGVWVYPSDEDGSPRTQDFSERLVIPVFDLDGELVTFQGRALIKDAEPRYLFPKGLPGTGRFLLNGQNVKGQARIAVGEGAFDAMSIHAALGGRPSTRDVGVVGTFGKHLSYGSMDGDDQLGRFLKLKHLGLREVTLMWDGGAKELIAALDAAKLLVGLGLIVKIARLPEGYDPNEITPEAVREAFVKALKYTTILDMQWRLKNPYSRPLSPVRIDLSPASA